MERKEERKEERKDGEEEMRERRREERWEYFYYIRVTITEPAGPLHLRPRHPPTPDL